MKPRYKVCPACRGKGQVFGAWDPISRTAYTPCPLCRGEGKIDQTEVEG
jgi:DnaJ-class molecular chaperone